MKIVIQRVKEASVKIENEIRNQIQSGLLLLVAVEDADTDFDLDYAIRKISKMRIFSDENGKMNLSVQDISGEVLSISQFTLYADIRKGTRPSFSQAGNPAHAEAMYLKFNEKLNQTVTTKSGEFGADMEVSLINDGPVTIIIYTKNERK